MATEKNSTMEVTFDLLKAAAKSGGDKYGGKVQGQEWVVYFPQTISRPDGKTSKKVIGITIKTNGE